MLIASGSENVSFPPTPTPERGYYDVDNGYARSAQISPYLAHLNARIQK